jgi:hypothetical protein
MMEYSSPVHRVIRVAKSLCTLEDFVHFVDDEFDFAFFADLLPTSADLSTLPVPPGDSRF